MLHEYKCSSNKCDEDEFLTIKDLYKSCKKLKQFISIVADDLNLDVDILGEYILQNLNKLCDSNDFLINFCCLGKALEANDNLIEVCDLYKYMIEDNKPEIANNLPKQSDTSNLNSDLLNSIFSNTDTSSDLSTIQATNFDSCFASNLDKELTVPDLMETFDENLNAKKGNFILNYSNF